MRITPTSAETVPQLLHAIGTAYGDERAVEQADEALSYQQLDEHSAVLARGLLARGVAKGSRVGLLLGNGPRFVTWWAALTRIGVVAVPLSTFAKAGELGRVVRHADLHALVVQRSFLRQDFAAHLEGCVPRTCRVRPGAASGRQPVPAMGGHDHRRPTRLVPR